MIYQVDATNPKGETLPMKLTRPDVSGMNIVNITGISPIGADIRNTPFASVDGGIFTGARVPSRNIVMTIAFDDRRRPSGVRETIEHVRHVSYNYFQIKAPVKLTFHTDERELYINGYVESNDVSIFNKQEYATISIVCVDPWFYATTQSARTLAGITPMFEFPFSSEDSGDIWPERIEFGRIDVDTRMLLFYEGDIQTGVNMKVNFIGSEFGNIRIMNTETREQMTIYPDQVMRQTGDRLSAGDELYISTVSGKKSAYILRNGVYTNVISAIDKDSDWLQLTKGDNIFAIASDYGVENVYIQIDFNNAYAGI